MRAGDALENATRYQPIHVQALFVGAASPADDRADLYSAGEKFAAKVQSCCKRLASSPKGEPSKDARRFSAARVFADAHFGMSGGSGRRWVAKRSDAGETTSSVGADSTVL